MQTKDFKTRTIIEKREFPSVNGYYGVSLDVGYSAVKGFGPHGYYCIPSYVRKRDTDVISLREENRSDILYRDRSGLWSVGELAYQELSTSEIIGSETELYTRMRYYSPSFIIPARVGLALTLAPDSVGCAEGKAIFVQTGLPPKYMDEDRKYITDTLTGSHEFELKIGAMPWKSFHFYIARGNIFVMPQPMGSMISVSVGKDGRPVPDARKYLNSNVVILDPGFGTLDDYEVVKGTIQGKGETSPELGMREILARTCNDLYETYGIKLLVPQLQERLDDGTIWVNDIRSMSRRSVDFSSFLDKNCHSVCMDALEKMKTVHGYFRNTDYIIGTGGTYDAWKNTFSEAFKGMEGLEIIPGNVNDESLPNIFSNSRGYYFRLIDSLKKKNRKQS